MTNITGNLITQRQKAVVLKSRFILICSFVFVAALLTTAYFCRTMSDEMKMPGDWGMSMMWMRMPGQTAFMSTLSFLFMWLAMMVAMMLPSSLPMFLKTGRNWISLCSMASGYFVIWLIAGLGVYILGMTLMSLAMESELISRAVPILAGASLIATGGLQFGRWKKTNLLCCRSAFGCLASFPEQEKSFMLGCKQGVACCACCAAPMMMQLILGIMNPLVMIIVAMVIAAEKLLPRPEITSRLVGLAAIITGISWILS